MPEERRSYLFGPYRLEPQAGRLYQREAELELPPKAFQVLTYLVEHRDRLVPKQELMQELWKDTFVTDDALVQAIITIRRVLGDDAEQPRFIRTKARLGYQFIAGVEIREPASEVAAVVRPAPVPVGRRLARLLLLVIQVWYLVLYSLVLLHLEAAAGIVERQLPRAGSVLISPLIIFLALCGIAVRLYLIASVAFDHAETGRHFGRLFPALFVLDLIWALAPLLLVGRVGLLALALVPLLVYSPFSQRTLIRSAYPSQLSQTS